MASVERIQYSPRNISQLEAEIEKYTQIRDQLLGSCKIKKGLLDDKEKNTCPDDITWRDRYIQQHGHNRKLEKNIENIKQKLEELKMLESELESEGVEHSDTTANINLRRQLARLAKEEEELEWELTDYGWKIDRMAHIIYRTEEERADLLTQLGQSDYQGDTPTDTSQSK